MKLLKTQSQSVDGLKFELIDKELSSEKTVYFYVSTKINEFL